MAKENPKKKLGLIHVYTGTGKGKTTASLGLMLRALGHDFKVLMIQFMKGQKDIGEIKAQKKFKGLEVIQFGEDALVDLNEPSASDIYLANQALDFARKRAMTMSARPDVMVLDEINIAIRFGLIPIEEVLDFLDNKPANMEVLLTGRYAHPKIMERADLVTEMKEVKHYFKKGFQARKGIEL